MPRLFTVLLLLAISIPAWPAEPALTGTVTDSLGAVIPGATVVLMQGGKDLRTATTDAAGKFQFKISQAGRYAVRAEAKTFAASTSQEVFAQPGHGVDVSLTLSPSRGRPEHCGHSHRPGDAGGADRNLDQRHQQHRPEHAHRFARRTARSGGRTNHAEWSDGCPDRTLCPRRSQRRQ